MIWVRFNSWWYSQNQIPFNSKFFFLPKESGGWKKAVQRDHADITACERATCHIKLLQHFPTATSVKGPGTGEKQVNPTSVNQGLCGHKSHHLFVSFTGSPPYTVFCRWMRRVLREREGGEGRNMKIKHNSLRPPLTTHHWNQTTHFACCK